MNIRFSRVFRFTGLAALLLGLSVSSRAGDTDISAVKQVLSRNCLDCHGSETREAGINLSALIAATDPDTEETRRLWTKVDRVIGRCEMPPADAGPLEPAARDLVSEWYRDHFILREGKQHIGSTPLRRLTRYELQNTLEDVLYIRLRPTYRDTITGTIERSQFASLIPSDIPGSSGFDNDAIRMESLKPPLAEISAGVNYALKLFSDDKVAIKTVLGRSELPVAATPEDARQCIASLINRACRCDGEQAAQLTAVWFEKYQQHYAVSQDSVSSLLHVFEMILISPHVLYRMELSQDLDQPYPVGDHELAVRLSYFLWSSTPDQELLDIAENGTLHEPAVLIAQIERMLNSPRRLSLAENFAAQWLGFADLLNNSEYFKDERWNREAYDEVLFFFDELIKSDRSVLELIQSDWAYRRGSAFNNETAPETGVSADLQNRFADVLGARRTITDTPTQYAAPRLVDVIDAREGGIVTTAAVMRLTASKSRTSPIRRGVWVLQTVIGRDLEPPPDVPSLEESRVVLALKKNPSVAEVLQQHVSRSECVSCHKAIDPLGLGLENFDELGEWRTSYPDKAPVMSSGTLPSGTQFQTPQELKQQLVQLYGDEIAENVVRQLFAYAIGRPLQPHDRVSVNAILEFTRADGYRLAAVIQQIVMSPQFLCRQDR